MLTLLVLVAPWRPRTRRHLSRLAQSIHLKSKSGPRVVVHAVSLGEVNAAAQLVRELCQLGVDVVCSSTTVSGRQRSQALHPSVEQVEWPLDISHCCNRWLDQVQPDVLVLVELEVWPTLVSLAKNRGIPVIVVNGRISDRSMRKSARIPALLRDGYVNLTKVFAQSEADLDRFIRMGVARERLSVCPNLKWDRPSVEPAAVEAMRLDLRLDADRPLVLFASSAPEEHKLFAESAPSQCQVVVAPRRPEWFDDASRSFAPSRLRTDVQGLGDTVVLNTLGELDLVFGLADVVVMGRSFGHRHGSDPMGPAAAGKPVLIGPMHSDFLPAVSALQEAGALKVVKDSELKDRLANLLNNPQGRMQMGEAGMQVAHSAQGVASRLAAKVAAYTQPPRRDRGGAEEKEESVHRDAIYSSASGGEDGQD